MPFGLEMSDFRNAERLNFYRLSCLILDVGTYTLQSLLEKEYLTTSDLPTFLNSKQRKLNKLYRRKVINQNQKELLQPGNGNNPKLETFDISLVSTLLTNLCSIPQPLAGWGVPPSANDISTGADVLRLRMTRNELYAHRVQSSMTDLIFQNKWKEIVNSVLRLSKQLEIQKQEQIQDNIENINTAHIDWERETEINEQIFNNSLNDILIKLEAIRPDTPEVISSDEVEDATDAEIPKGPDGIICVLKEYPKLKSDLTKVCGEEIARHLLKTKLIKRDEYEKIRDSSRARRICIDRLLKLVLNGKSELLECFFNKLKEECPVLANSLSKREVTQDDRNKFKQVQEDALACRSFTITVNHSIDEFDINFFQDHLCDSPELVDSINDELLSQFLISTWEHSIVTYRNGASNMTRTLFETIQSRRINIESILENKLESALFNRWTNCRYNRVHWRVLKTCLPILEKSLNFEIVFSCIRQSELLDESSCSEISKQAIESEKTKLLLYFIQQKNRSDYEKFKTCLAQCEQLKLKNVLEEEEKKYSPCKKTEDTSGGRCTWRALLEWIHTTAADLLDRFSEHFLMRFLSAVDGSIILKFRALKEFNVELLNQSEVQIRLEKLLRKGCLDTRIKLEGPVYVIVYIVSPGDDGKEEDIQFHLDFEAFHDRKESKENRKIKLLVEELSPSQLQRWILKRPEIGTDIEEEIEDIISRKGLSRREKMTFLLDIIMRLANSQGILEQFCKENGKYAYKKVFRQSEKTPSQGKIGNVPNLSYQKGGGVQKLYSMSININVDQGFTEKDSVTDKGQATKVHEEENINKGILEDKEKQNRQYLTILLFGNDKVGKTSTGNAILNYNGLCQNNYNVETGDPVCCSAKTSAVPGKSITVIDTPGFGLSKTKVIETIKHKCSSVRGKFVVLFVVRAKHVSYNECKESIRNFKKVFGRKFSDQTIVVVTHLDNLGGNMNVDTFLSSCCSQLKRFITKHNSQVCFFDNVTPNSDILSSQVTRLMSIIESDENSTNESQTNTGSWNFLLWSAAAVVIGSLAIGAIYAAR